MKISKNILGTISFDKLRVRFSSERSQDIYLIPTIKFNKYQGGIFVVAIPFFWKFGINLWIEDKTFWSQYND